MAEVFVARRLYGQGIEKVVALKRIRPEYSQDPTFSQLFLQEARIALRLNHPNVVQVHDFGEVDGHLFLAMELVDGWDLRRLRNTLAARGERLELPLCHYIAWAVCRALDYVHELSDPAGLPWGLVHQDVGHPNILISRDGQVKLTDFGVARISAEGKGSLRGRPGYMSPEQLRGERVDQRSDLYSLGVVLFELLTDQRLFRGSDSAGTLWRSLYAPVPLPSSLLPELSGEVDLLLLALLERDREQRFSDTHALVSRLRRLLEPHSPDALADSLGALLRRLQAQEENTDLLGPGRQEATEAPTDAATELATPETFAATELYTLGKELAPPPPRRKEFPEAYTSATEIQAAAAPPPPPPRTSVVAVPRTAVRVRWAPFLRPESPSRRERWEAGIVVFLALFLITLLLGGLWWLRRAWPEPEPLAQAAPEAPPRAAEKPLPTHENPLKVQSAGLPRPQPAAGGPQPLVVRSISEESTLPPQPIPPVQQDIVTMEAPIAAPAAFGTVDIRVREGWGRVRIDGKAWKNPTPLVGIELTEGRHLIQVEIPSTGRIYSREVTLVAGEKQILELGP